MEVTGEGSDHQVEGMGVRPASVASTAPPARGCSAASAGPAVVQPGDQILITMRIFDSNIVLPGAGSPWRPVDDPAGQGVHHQVLPSSDSSLENNMM